MSIARRNGDVAFRISDDGQASLRRSSSGSFEPGQEGGAGSSDGSGAGPCARATARAQRRGGRDDERQRLGCDVPHPGPKPAEGLTHSS